MTTITIYKADGTELLTTAVPKGSTLKRELMKEDYITLKLSLAAPLSFPLGCYCDTDFGRYTVVDTVAPSVNSSTGGYDYELRLDADHYKWKNKLFKYRPQTGGQEASWSLTAQITVFMEAFMANLTALGYDKTAGGTAYTVAIDNSVTAEAKALTFSDTSLIDALTAIAEAFDCDWWVDSGVIHMGECETGEAVTVESGVDTSGFDVSDSSGSYATRLYVFGGTTNVPLRYRKKLVFDVLERATTAEPDGNVRYTLKDTARPLSLNMFSGISRKSYATDDFSSVAKGGSIRYGHTLYTESGDRFVEKIQPTASVVLDTLSRAVPEGMFSTDATDTFVKLAVKLYQTDMEAPTVKFAVRLRLTETEDPGGTALVEKTLTEEMKVADGLLLQLPAVEEWYTKARGYGSLYAHVSLTVTDEKYQNRDKTAEKTAWAYSSFYFTACIVNRKYSADGLSYFTFETGTLRWLRHSAETTVRLVEGTYDPRHVSSDTQSGEVFANGGGIDVVTSDVIPLNAKFTLPDIITAKVPVGYFISDTGEETTVTAITEQRLMLPQSFNGGHNWIDAEEDMADGEIVESVVTMDDIYPTLTSTTDSIQTYRQEVKDDNDKGTGQYETFYLVGDSALTFSEDYRLNDEDFTVLFYTGKLAGMRFTAYFRPKGHTIKGVVLADGSVGTLTVTAETGAFELVASEDYGRKLPDTVLYPSEGDTFSVGGYDASYFSELGLVEAAEARLLAKGQEYMEKCKRDGKTYTASLFWWRAAELQLAVGRKVTLKDASLFPTEGRESRVTGCELSLDIPDDNPQYTFGVSSTYSRLGELEAKLDSLAFQGTTYIGGGSSAKGNAVDILTADDLTTPTDSNVNSARRSESRYLSKKSDDTASGHLTLASGLTSRGAASLEEGMTVGTAGAYGVDSGGNVKAADIEALTAQITSAILDYLQSSDYDTVEQTGFGFYRKSGGRYGLNITDLMVWGKAVFNSLEIRKLYSVGGNIVLSPSASKLFKVDEYYETAADGTQTQTGWKCWLLADDGTTATTNQWQVDDQARCQTFDIAEGAYEGVSNKNYWRRVTAVSTENETISSDDGTALYDGQKFAWIVLSKDDCMEGSDAPSAGDTIVCLGNRNSTGESADRANVIMLETVGEDAPLIALYRQVFGYSLKDTCVFRLSYNGVDVVSKYFREVSASGEREWRAVYRGEWKSTTVYTYYDEVTWRGTRWLCIAPADGEGTQSEPSETNDLWLATTAVQHEKLVLEMNGQDTLDWGESIKVTASVMLGDDTVDTSSGWEWSVERSSGDATEDAAWNAGSKASAFSGVITLSFSESCNDLGAEQTGVYGTVFTFRAWQTGSKASAVKATLSV